MTLIVINISFQGAQEVIHAEMKAFIHWLKHPAKTHGFHQFADEELPASRHQPSPLLPHYLHPGTSLGGARPKASVIDEDGSLTVAKFPSRTDYYNVAQWEHFCHVIGRKPD